MDVMGEAMKFGVPVSKGEPLLCRRELGAED